MSSKQIPIPVLVVAAEVLANYHTHNEINLLFWENGAPGDPPDGSKPTKCLAWLKAINNDGKLDSSSILGKLLEQFMEVDRYGFTLDTQLKSRNRLTTVLSKHGLSYQTGGRIYGLNSSAPTQSLENLLKDKSLSTLDTEFRRSLENVEKDPAASLTAACAILESLCKVYIEEEGLQLPNKDTAKPLWSVVQKDLGLDPSSVEDDDLKKILSGLSSVVDGIASLRTHAGSAHGKGSKKYRVEPRHARLAIHGAHTLCGFVLETWQTKSKKK